jgi:hypothetical protein
LYTVVWFWAARPLRMPPRPRRGKWGGVFRSPEKCWWALKAICCDGVAMPAVSSRCRLKSLRSERSGWPLNHREIGERAVPRAKEVTTAASSGAPVCTCNVLFGDRLSKLVTAIPRQRLRWARDDLAQSWR